MYRLAHYFATLPENSALCQGDRACELISRPELRQTDRRADEAKTDDTEMAAVTGHLRPVGLRWPVTAVSVASASPRLHVGQFVAILVSKSARALYRSDSALFSGSVAKSCANLYTATQLTIESVGLRKCLYKRYLTKKVMSEQETFCRA